MELIERKEKERGTPNNQANNKQHITTITWEGDEQQRTMTDAAPGGGMLGSGVGNMLDAGAATGAAGDLPGICSGMTSTG
jgi:hypothetical protein